LDLGDDLNNNFSGWPTGKELYMDCKSISFEKFITQPFKIWEKDWLLLTSGDYVDRHYNCMTVGWGSVGIMWGRPFIQVVVRPHRYTYQFMEQYPTFTVCAFPKLYRKALNILGTKSGRDGDKIAEAGLTPQTSTVVPAPSFAEAELVMECKKMFWSDFDPSHFIDPGIDHNYPKKDYHRSYFGEIVSLRGIAKYTHD
jgi:flavin reductase (DIM6/NTAB) family NADH-FMN oxidoreductase RutF